MGADSLEATEKARGFSTNGKWGRMEGRVGVAHWQGTGYSSRFRNNHLPVNCLFGARNYVINTKSTSSPPHLPS